MAAGVEVISMVLGVVELSMVLGVEVTSIDSGVEVVAKSEKGLPVTGLWPEAFNNPINGLGCSSSEPVVRKTKMNTMKMTCMVSVRKCNWKKMSSRRGVIMVMQQTMKQKRAIARSRMRVNLLVS